MAGIFDPLIFDGVIFDTADVITGGGFVYQIPKYKPEKKIIAELEEGIQEAQAELEIITKKLDDDKAAIKAARDAQALADEIMLLKKTRAALIRRITDEEEAYAVLSALPFVFH